jgi:glycosyltransferase involved in cell wall biosynthesis
MHYRIPILNILAQKYNLTVGYSYLPSNNEVEKCNFTTQYFPLRKIWRFHFHKDNLLEYCNHFDVVIALGQIAWLSLANLARKKRRLFKIAYWGIGVSASYNRKYDDGNILIDKFKDFFYKNADALIFYTDYPIAKHKKRGYSKEKLFVANNTVKVEKFDEQDNVNKDSILFIGTLYMEKGLLTLLEAYKSAYNQNSLLPKLNIVGGGVQIDLIKEWVRSNDMEEKICLLGSIYDVKEKSNVFRRALACISPSQAGLSVLESMGYGVPFITHKDAITGGEAFNITNGVTGLRLNNLDVLGETILDIADNPQKYIEMGEKAYKYYWSYRKPEDMAKGLSDSIEYML